MGREYSGEVGRVADEEARQRNLACIKKFRLLDDVFFEMCLHDCIEAGQRLARVIIDDDSIVVETVEVQKEFKSLQAHSFRFDAYLETQKDQRLEIEIQRDDRGAVPERANCHIGVLDANSLGKNEKDYSKKAETFSIFITEHDTEGLGLPLYHVERCVLEADGRLFGGKSHILYVNGAYDDGGKTAIGRLLHDLRCSEPDEMYDEVLADRVRYFKQDDEGVEKMCELMDNLIKDGEDRGEAKGLASAVRALMKNTQKSAQEAMDMLSVPAEKREAVAALL